MEQFSLNGKESGVNRVVGFGPEKEEEILESFERVFDQNFTESKEKVKSVEQLEVIERINVDMHDFLVRYGVEAIEIPAPNIHIPDKTKFNEEDLGKLGEKYGKTKGVYSATKQGVAILRDYDVSKLLFMQTIVHEMLHIQGFYSYQKSEREDADISFRKGDERSSMNIRRSGFSIGTRDGDELLFDDINEAVITELEIRFEKEFMVRYPELMVELQRRDDYVKKLSARDKVPIEQVGQTVAGINGDETSGHEWVTYPYHAERLQLEDLINRLYEENMDSYESREDVFNLFANATLTGKLLPIARLVEKTFGKGAFRALGEESRNG